MVWPDAGSVQQKIDLAKRLGVRGISMDENDRAISLSILEHIEATPAERAADL